MILGGKEYTVDAADLERICELGRGAYGTVEKRRHIQSGTVLAVKVLLCSKILLPFYAL